MTFRLNPIRRLVLPLLAVLFASVSLVVLPAERADAASSVVTGTATLPGNDGYWTTTAEGRVAISGKAAFLGDLRSVALNKPVTGMASSPTGKGYWLVASDGGIFAFGDAKFFGSTGSIRLNKPVTAMTSSKDGNGYWLVASDGGIFSFGTASFFGSTGSLNLNQPVVGMASSPTGKGYWLVASDGGIFAFGDAPFRGSSTGNNASVFGLTTDGKGGYSILRSDGAVLHHLAPGISNPTRPTTTTTAAPAPTTTTTAAPQAPASGNPFTSRSLWNDTYNPALDQANAWRNSRPADAALLQRMGETSSAMWIGGWSGDVRNAINNVTTSAAASNKLPVFIAYNIPGRDCGQWSSGGLSGAAAYNQWISDFADGIGNRHAVVVLEPDALSQLDCLDAAGKTARLDMLRNAVNVLESKPNATVYIDAGHPGWHSADEMANRLRAAGVGNARGFALNVSNYTATNDNLNYGTDLANKLGGSKFVVDTSRNGNGSNGEWCNPSGRALGQQPTTNTGRSQADALLWLKRPGESDGQCNGGPSAGQFWADYALGLAQRAWN